MPKPIHHRSTPGYPDLDALLMDRRGLLKLLGLGGVALLGGCWPAAEAPPVKLKRRASKRRPALWRALNPERFAPAKVRRQRAPFLSRDERRLLFKFQRGQDLSSDERVKLREISLKQDELRLTGYERRKKKREAMRSPGRAKRPRKGTPPPPAPSSVSWSTRKAPQREKSSPPERIIQHLKARKAQRTRRRHPPPPALFPPGKKR